MSDRCNRECSRASAPQGASECAELRGVRAAYVAVERLKADVGRHTSGEAPTVADWAAAERLIDRARDSLLVALVHVRRATRGEA